jgi:hypothetical protein
MIVGDLAMFKFLFIISFFFLTSCASITQGTKQVISFQIDPAAAICDVSNKDGVLIGTISSRSNLLQVSKGVADLTVKCSAPGYESKVTKVASSAQTAGVLGVAIDLGITDMITGAMWQYPDQVPIVLTPKKSPLLPQ